MICNSFILVLENLNEFITFQTAKIDYILNKSSNTIITFIKPGGHEKKS